MCYFFIFIFMGKRDLMSFFGKINLNFIFFFGWYKYKIVCNLNAKSVYRILFTTILYIFLQEKVFEDASLVMPFGLN